MSDRVVLESGNVDKLASNLYLAVHSLPQEDHHDTDDASAGEISPIRGMRDKPPQAETKSGRKRLPSRGRGQDRSISGQTKRAKSASAPKAAGGARYCSP